MNLSSSICPWWQPNYQYEQTGQKVVEFMLWNPNASIPKSMAVNFLSLFSVTGCNKKKMKIIWTFEVLRRLFVHKILQSQYKILHICVTFTIIVIDIVYTQKVSMWYKTVIQIVVVNLWLVAKIVLALWSFFSCQCKRRG